MPMIILGVSCGDENQLALLRHRHEALLSSADLVSAAPRFLEQLKDLDQLCLAPLEFPIRPYLARLGEMAKGGKQVLLLADGDPLFFGLGSTLADMGADWPISFIPSVSSLQTACARIGLPWDNLPCISLHGRSDTVRLCAILPEDYFCLLTGTGPGPDFAARLLLDRSSDEYEAHVFEHLGCPGEKIASYDLESCAKTHFGNNCLAIFRKTRRARLPWPMTGQKLMRGAYCTPELMRGLVLQLLRIESENTVWDIGAGSGMLSCDMAARAWRGQVLAIEEKSGRALDIQHNRKIMSRTNLNLILGHAPDILEKLPMPDRIFIGGGLSAPDASSLLDFCITRLAPGGRLAISCVLLENFHKCLAHPWGDDCLRDFIQVQISHSDRLGQGMRLAPANPVFMFHVWKKEDSASAGS